MRSIPNKNQEIPATANEATVCFLTIICEEPYFLFTRSNSEIRRIFLLTERHHE